MRRKIAIFLCMMMVFAMTTGVAMAANKVGEGQQDDKSYTETSYGVVSKFCARATSDTVYSTIENTANVNKYLSCYVREYKVNIGWIDYQGNSATVLPGIQINAIMDRNLNLIGHYYHMGRCAYNNYSSQVQDTHEYTAYQWYYTK